MEKINFSNGEKISAAKVTIDNVDYEVTPAVYDGATPLNATVFNNMQENIEDAIDEKADSEDVYTKQEVNSLIPTKAHQINVGEDTDYRVNLSKTENLFDKNSIVSGYRIGQQGNYNLDASYFASVFIKVKPNTAYTISKAGAGQYSCYATYQQDKNVIARSSFISGTSVTFTTPANCYYLVICDVWANLDTFQLEEGSTATEYTPFIPNQINVDNEKYSDTINVGVTEDSRSRVNFIKGTNLFDKNNYNILSAYFDTNLTISSATNPKLIYIECEGSKTYTIQKVKSARLRIATTTTTPAIGGTIQDYQANDTGTTLTITTSATAKYLLVYCYQANEDSLSLDTILASLIIQEGSSIIVPSIKVDNEEIYAKPEIGTNENGSYIKYANGLMICSGVKSFTGANFTTQNGAVYIPASSPSINFAQQFIENPVVTLTAFNRANGVYESGLSTSLVAIWPFAFSSISNVNYSIHYIAIGRWK